MDTHEIDDTQDTDLEPVGSATRTGGFEFEPQEAAPLRLGWLYAAGGLCLAAAAGVFLLPKLVPGQGWIARSIAQHGAPAAVLGFAGLACFVLARTARSLAGTIPPPAPIPPDHGPAIEELSAKQLQVRASLQDVRVEFVHLKEAVTRMSEARAASEEGTKLAQDSMFRLAASVDQLGGQITRRLEQGEWSLGERMRELDARIADIASSVAALSASTLAAAAPVQDAQPGAAYAGDLQVPYGYEPSADDLHVEVDLEPEGFGRLGVLDEIEDGIGYTSPAPAVRSGQGDRRSDSLRGPLPRTAGSNDALGGIDFAEKLELARALLADPLIQASLSNSNRSAR